MLKLFRKLFVVGADAAQSGNSHTPEWRIAPDGDVRGNLDLYRDRSQHRRYTARYEDMLN